MTKKNTYKYVKDTIESNTGWKLLSENYIKNNIKLHMLCNNNHDVYLSFANFISGQRCKECYLDNNKGENNPNWKPNKNPLDREIERNIDGYTDWVYSVYERDNYTCQCCGKKSDGDMNAHHLDGYNWCKERRLDVSNGISLCGKCHTDFHRNYGYGDNTENQFISWVLDNGIGIFTIDEMKKNSILKNRPLKKTLLEKHEIYKKYYEEHIRKYSEEDIDNIFYEVLNDIKQPYVLTTTGFFMVTGISSISCAKTLKINNWINVLKKYNKVDILYEYVKNEYMKFYLSTYSCDFRKFTHSHPYITQDIIKQFTIKRIKNDTGFLNQKQVHNLKGLTKNLLEIIDNLGRIPYYNEFINLSKISISSYYNYFNTMSYENILSKIINDENLLNKYYEDKNLRDLDISAIGGRSTGYTDEEKEIEFRRVFDSYYDKTGKYPSRKQFNELSKFSEKAYMKKWKLTWNQVREKYGYLT